MEDGWIEWGGGDCPVDAETMVRVRLRDDGLTPYHPCPAGAWCDVSPSYWQDSGMDSDIVAYKVMSA